MKVLLSTDGSPGSERSAVFASGLRLIQGSQVTLLAVREHSQSEAASLAHLDRLAGGLDRPASVARITRQGDPAHEITLEAQRAPYDLLVLMRHPARHLPPIVSRSGTHVLARRIPSHLLLVRNPPEQPRRILVCLSGEGPSGQTLAAAGGLIRHASVDISLIHVMSQVSLSPDSLAAELEETVGEAIQGQTLEGHRLQEGIEILKSAGVDAPIRPVLRHGLVVDEVLAEVEEGGHDLVVLGSHYQPGLTRWMDVLLDNVASALLDRIPCSVLIVGPAGRGQVAARPEAGAAAPRHEETLGD